MIFTALATVAALDPHGTLATQHSSDAITILLWILGVLGAALTALSAGILYWAVMRILDHDQRIVRLETRCEDNHNAE